MNTIVRNFMSVVRRFKLATVLNVLGLSVAYVAFMLIMMQVNYDNRFDSCQPEGERIFRLDVGDDDGWQCIMPRPFARLFAESSPHIEAGYISRGSRNVFFAVERNGERMNFMEPWGYVTPGITRVFDFEMLEGDVNALEEPNSCILSESLARKFFGDEPALNRQLLPPDPNDGQTLTVKGVYRDFPRNSTLGNMVYVPISQQENYNDWSNSNYYLFVRLDNAANKDLVLENFRNDEKAKAAPTYWKSENINCTLNALPELHFLNTIAYDLLPKANRQTLLVLSSIAVIILVIAGINFTNFSTSLAPMRLRSINTQKVLGSTNGMLRMALCAEAVGISLVAYLVSLYLLYVVKRTPIVSLIDAEVSFAGQLDILLLTGAIAVCVGLLAGLYPAFYMTSFQPAMVLKGNFGLSPAGKRMRNVLVGIQYVASFAYAACTARL